MSDRSGRWEQSTPVKHLRIFVVFLVVTIASLALAECRSAKDMQAECRVAPDVLSERAGKTFQSALFAGERIGYAQAAADATRAFAENVSWIAIMTGSSADRGVTSAGHDAVRS